MKISIVIPCYNVENYISRCLDSVIGQTYKNIEIICVNDGSIDSTLKILKEYKKKDNRIIIINQKNSGANIARKNGIKKSTGAYIMFVDSDDYIKYNVINDLINIIIKEHVDIVKFEFINYDFWNKKIKPGTYKEKKFLYKELLTSNLLNNITTQIVSKKIINLSDSVFNLKSSSGEDLLMNLYFFDRAEKIKFINKRYYFYSYNENSTTNTLNPYRLINFIKESDYVLTNLLIYAKKWDLIDNPDVVDRIYYRIIIDVCNRVIDILNIQHNKKVDEKLTSVLSSIRISKIDFYKIIKKYQKNIIKQIIYINIFKHNYLLVRLFIKVKNRIKRH